MADFDMMGAYGRIVVLKRSGKDGKMFPLIENQCTFGRDGDCDIRIQLPNVSQFHTELKTDKQNKVSRAPFGVLLSKACCSFWHLSPSGWLFG